MLQNKKTIATNDKNYRNLTLTVIATLLLAAPFLFAGEDDEGMTSRQGEIMKHAIESENFSNIQYLLSEGVGINTPYHGDGTMLMLAVRYNNLDLVKKLVALKADVNQSSSGDGNPLIIAAQNGNLAIAGFLLSKGANVNAVVKGDETPLINASKRGDLEMVKLLVNNGADVNLRVKVPGELRSPLNQARNSSVRNYLESLGTTK